MYNILCDYCKNTFPENRRLGNFGNFCSIICQIYNYIEFKENGCWVNHKNTKSSNPSYIIRDGRTIYFKKYLYEQKFGIPFPVDKYARLLCDKSCVNPEHFKLIAQKDLIASKLSAEQKNEIIDLYNKKIYNKKELSKIYNIGYSVIRKLLIKDTPKRSPHKNIDNCAICISVITDMDEYIAKYNNTGPYCSLKCKIISNMNIVDGCWIWNGSVDNSGKPIISYKAEKQGVARLLYKKLNPTINIPLNLLVLKKCFNNACVNPDHIFLGTKGDFQEGLILGNKKSRILSEQDKQKIVHLRIDNKWPTTHIAAEFSVSETAIRKVLIKCVPIYFNKTKNIIDQDSSSKFMDFLDEEFK